MSSPSRAQSRRLSTSELQRLSIKDLKALIPRGESYQPVDRHDLIDQLIKTGAIDLVDGSRHSTQEAAERKTPPRPSLSRQRSRLGRGELQKLSVRELKGLLPPGDDYQAFDSYDLIDHLIFSGAVDLVDRPPIKSKLSDLHRMSISQLKRCMNEKAGVFFDWDQVVEKKDMIDIFYDSGMLEILSESGDEGGSALPTVRKNNPLKASSIKDKEDVGTENNNDYKQNKRAQPKRQSQTNKRSSKNNKDTSTQNNSGSGWRQMRRSSHLRSSVNQKRQRINLDSSWCWDSDEDDYESMFNTPPIQKHPLSSDKDLRRSGRSIEVTSFQKLFFRCEKKERIVATKKNVEDKTDVYEETENSLHVVVVEEKERKSLQRRKTLERRHISRKEPKLAFLVPWWRRKRVQRVR